MLNAGEKAWLAATLEACCGSKASGRIQTLRSKGRTNGSLGRELSRSPLFAESREGELNGLAGDGLAALFDSLAASPEAEDDVLNPSARAGPGGAGLLAA